MFEDLFGQQTIQRKPVPKKDELFGDLFSIPEPPQAPQPIITPPKPISFGEKLRQLPGAILGLPGAIKQKFVSKPLEPVSTFEKIKQLPSAMNDTLARIDKKLETAGGILEFLPAAMGETLGIPEAIKKVEAEGPGQIPLAGIEVLAKLGDAIITAPFRLTKGVIGIVSPEFAEKIIPENVKHPLTVPTLAIARIIGKDEWMPHIEDFFRDIEIGKSYQTQQQENIDAGMNPWLSGVSVMSNVIFDAAIVGGMAEGYLKGITEKAPADSFSAKQARDIIGVQKGATEAEIKSAYRTKAHIVHPDKPVTGNEILFKELNKANQTLTGVLPQTTRFQDVANALIKKRSVWSKVAEEIKVIPTPVSVTKQLGPPKPVIPIPIRPPVPEPTISPVAPQVIQKPTIQKPVVIPTKPIKFARLEENIIEYQRSGVSIEDDIQPRNPALEAVEDEMSKPGRIEAHQREVGKAIKSGELKPDADGNIQLFRVGEPQREGLVSATYNEEVAKRFSPEAEENIIKFKVKPDDIKVFIGQEEAEVLVSADIITKPTPQPPKFPQKPTIAPLKPEIGVKPPIKPTEATAEQIKLQEKVRIKEIQNIETKIREVYKTKKDEVGNALGEIFTEMDISEAGDRIFLDSGQVEGQQIIGVPSTFPQWIPQELRSKELFEKVMKDLVDIDNLTFPTANKSKQRELYNTLLEEVDKRTGLDTSNLRENILDVYAKTKEKEIKQVTEVVDRGVTRGETIKEAKPEVTPKKVEILKVKTGTQLQEELGDKALSDDFKAIEGRAFDLIAKNKDKLIKEYIDKFGKIVNTDKASELFPEYVEDRTRRIAVHEPAGVIKRAIFDKYLTENKGQGNNIVRFTAGGTGAGKTSAIDNMPALNAMYKNSPIVVDTNLANIKSAVRDIEKALDAGYFVDIDYTLRDPIDAFVNGALPRAMKTGRVVPVEVHVDTHLGSRKVILELLEKYKEVPQIKIRLVNNNFGKNKARIVAKGKPTIDILKKEVYNKEELIKQLNVNLKEEFNKGTISKTVFEGTRGVFRGEGQASRPGGERVGRKPEQERASRITEEVVPEKAIKQPPSLAKEAGFDLEKKPKGKEAKVAKSIEAKAKEKGIIAEFEGLAEFKPVVIKEQIALIDKLMADDINKAKRMAIGEELLDPNIKGAMLVKMMEDYAMAAKDGDFILALANSPLVSETSEAGQTLRLIRERVQDSATQKISEIKKEREGVAKKKRRGKTEKDVKKDMKKALDTKIKTKKVSKYDWNNLISEIAC